MASSADARYRPSLLRGKLWFWGPIVPLIALDLWSKAAAFRFLAERYPTHGPSARRHEVWESFIDFDLVSWGNTGTVWGLAGDFNGPLVVLRCVALVVIVYFAWRLPAHARLYQLVLGGIFAGAVGNLYDNLTQPEGAVRDFLLFSARIGGDVYRWPAFNVADACITVGAITLAILLWRSSPIGAPQVPEEAARRDEPSSDSVAEGEGRR